MRLSALSLQIVVLLVACNAAPVYREPSVEAREDLPLLDVRDEDSTEDGLVARGLPGMRHKLEEDPPVTAFHPLPEGHYFQTATNVYSTEKVTSVAERMFKKVQRAPKYDSRAKSSLRTYPKPGSGFPASNSDNPAPNNGEYVAYHDTMKSRYSAPGPDRIIAYRKKEDRLHTIVVAYHDPLKPIPAAQPGQTPPTSNPFSIARPKKGTISQ